QTRLHRTHGDTQRERNVLVAQAIDLPQDDHRALLEGQPGQSVAQPGGQFLLGQPPFRSEVRPAQTVAVSGDARVEGDLIGAVTAPPEPVPVASLVDGDPIDPCAQSRLPAKPMDRPEYP